MTRRERLKRWVDHGQEAGGRPEWNRLRSTARELVLLAWPIAAAMFGETAMGLVDTKLVGGLGAGALGGVGVATSLMFLNYAVVFGLMRGVKVRTAYAVGRGSPADGQRYAQAGVVMGALAGTLVWCVGRDITWALVLVRTDASLVPYARDFLAAITYGAPATCVLAALIQHRQALGDARTPMIIGLTGNVVNALLAYALIYGRFGLPALGVRGAGYGTATTETLEVLVMLAMLAKDARRNAASRSFVSQGAPRLAIAKAAREVAELGVPTGVQFGCEMLAFATLSAILGNIGGAEIAAHQIALATIRTSFLPGIAVGEAACVLVGRSLGARRVDGGSRATAARHLDEADRVTLAALAVAGAFMTACGVVFALFGGAIASTFTTDPEVARIARRLLWVAAVFQLLDAFNIVLRGALRGAKDVRVAAVIGIVVVWTCVPTAAFLLGKLAGWGALGGWCGFLGETAFASVLFYRRWTRGAWRREFA